MTASAARISPLQRRLDVMASLPHERWINVAENIPEWPAGRDPLRDYAFGASGGHGYAPAAGLPDLRKVVAARERAMSGYPVTPRHVLITAGGLHAIGLVLRHCAALGSQRVIYPEVTFLGVHDAIRASGLEPVPVRATGDLADWDEIRRHAALPCVVYLNLPHNPTGAVLTPRYAEALRGFVAQHPHVVVLLDAVYDAFVFDEHAVVPLDLALTTEQFVVVNSMSKNYGRPGDRVGWAVAADSMVVELAARLEWEAICVSPTQQLLAGAAIQAGNDALVEAVRVGRRALLDLAEITPCLATLRLPPGGTQVTVELPVSDVEAFAAHALHTERLVLTTSSNYAPTPPSFIRLPVGVPPDRLRAAVGALGRALAGWQALDNEPEGTGRGIAYPTPRRR